MLRTEGSVHATMIYYLWVTSGFDRIGEAKGKAYKMAEEYTE
jgi:hypothetical protein